MRFDLVARLALALFLVACTPPEGRFRCTTAAECPPAWACRGDHLCWSTPGSGDVDAGERDASTLDAGPLDAPALDAGTPEDTSASPDSPAQHDANLPACDPTLGLVAPPSGGAVCSPFGGFYLVSDVGAGCLVENPFTDHCSCPDGFTDSDMTSFQSELESGGRLHSCLWPGAVATPGWGGIYIFDETHSACIFSNRITLICSCPSTIIADWRGLNSVDEQLHLVFCGEGEPVDAGAFGDAFTMRTGLPTSCPAVCVSAGGCGCAADQVPHAFPGMIDTGHCVTENVLCAPMF
jgi:hypothetical protein